MDKVSGTKATYAVTEGGKLIATDVEITGKITSNYSGDKIEIDPSKRALILGNETKPELAKLWFINGSPQLILEDSFGNARTIMSSMTTEMRFLNSQYLCQIQPNSIIHNNLPRGKPSDGHLQVLTVGSFIADTSQTSNGYAVLRVKVS